MAGGYITCGDYHGNDKSGSAITGVFDELAQMLPPHQRDVFLRRVIEPLLQQFDETGEYFLISRPAALELLPLVDGLFVRLKERFHGRVPWEVLDRDKSSGIDPLDAKYGAGPDWQYYCVADLRTALQLCIDTQEPICVLFD